MEISRGTMEQIDAVTDVANQCREALNAQGIVQWDAHYPNRAFFAQAVANNELFVLTEDGTIQGMVVMDESQAPGWDTIPWQDGAGRFRVIHSLAVLPTAQGRGYGAALLGACESVARESSYTSLRLDVYSGNAAALRFYARHGYQVRGTVEYPFKLVGCQRYECCEKALEPQEFRQARGVGMKPHA